MNRLKEICPLAVLGATAVGGLSQAEAQGLAPVIVYAIQREVPSDLDRYITRLLESAESLEAAALVLTLDAWQGDFERVRPALSLLAASELPTYALVQGVALDVGALVALATDDIFVVPGSSIGGSDEANRETAREATQKAKRDEFMTLGARHGLDSTLVRAMVDGDQAIEGLVTPGEVLSLSAEGAVHFGAATEVANLEALLGRLGLGESTILTASREAHLGTIIQVTNNGWRDLTVFLLRGGSARQRLGLVTALSKREYLLNPTELSEGETIRLGALPIGGGAGITTERIQAGTGVVIQWLLENNLSYSSLVFFRP